MPDTGPSQCSLSAFRFSSLHLPQPLHAGLAKGGGILVKKTRKVSVVPGVSRTSPPLGHWAQEAPSSGLKVVLLHPGSPAHPLRGSPGTGPVQPAWPKVGPVSPGQRPAPPVLWAPDHPRRRTDHRDMSAEPAWLSSLHLGDGCLV